MAKQIEDILKGKLKELNVSIVNIEKLISEQQKTIEKLMLANKPAELQNALHNAEDFFSTLNKLKSERDKTKLECDKTQEEHRRNILIEQLNKIDESYKNAANKSAVSAVSASSAANVPSVVNALSVANNKHMDRKHDNEKQQTAHSQKNKIDQSQNQNPQNQNNNAAADNKALADQNHALSLEDRINIIWSQIDSPIFYASEENNINKLAANAKPDNKVANEKNEYELALQKAYRSSKEKSCKQFCREIILSGGPHFYRVGGGEQAFKNKVLQEIRKHKFPDSFWEKPKKAAK